MFFLKKERKNYFWQFMDEGDWHYFDSFVSDTIYEKTRENISNFSLTYNKIEYNFFINDLQVLIENRKHTLRKLKNKIF